MVEGYVIRKSPERKFGGKFVSLQDVDDPFTGYTFLIFPDGEGDYPPIFMYNKVKLDGDASTSQVTKFDINDQGKQFNRLVFYKKSTWRVTGRLVEHRSVDVPLATVKFYHAFLQSEAFRLTLDAKVFGFDYFPLTLNDVQLDGVLKVAGDFEVSLRKVAGVKVAGGKAEWEKAYKYVDGTLDISGSDLSVIKPIVSEMLLDSEREAALNALIEEMRVNGTFLDIFNARLYLRNRGMNDEIFNDKELEDALNSAAMHKDYNPAFFHELKNEMERGSSIYYSNDGFLFKIGNRWVWEVPKPNVATYMFKGEIDVNVTRSFLSKVSRAELLKNKSMQDEFGFIGRAIHPPEDENGVGIARWLKDVCRGTGVKHEVME